MEQELLESVKQKYPEIDTKNQVLHQEFDYDGYNVAIFYTLKDSGYDRYVTAILTDNASGELEYLEPIPMVNVYEMGLDYDDIVPDSQIDVEDINATLKEVEYTIRKRTRLKRSLYSSV